MSELPNGWSETTLGALSEYITSGSRDWSKYYSETGALFVRTQDINTNKINHISSIAKVLLPEKVEGKRTLIQKGDILITITGANVGKCAHVAEELPEAYVSQSVALVRLIDSNLAKFIQLQLITPTETDFKTALEASAYGMGRPVLNLDNVRDVTVKLAPLTEQTRIAQKIDELLAQVDTLKARIDAIPALLKRFRQSVLAAAVSGRLTEEWRATLESADSWKSVPVGVLCNSAFDGPFGSKLKSDDYTAKGVRVVRLENIGHLSFIGEKKTFISEAKHAELSKNTLRTGDILFSSFVDEEIRVCRLPKSEEIFINKADCFCLRIDDTSANPSFVMHALAAKHTYQRIRESVHGATRPRINLGFLKSFEIDLPPQAEQTEIVRCIEQLFAFADQLEAKVATAQARIDRLTQSILAKAFRGELVPQDPNDEPASLLLERIQAQRAAAPKAKRGRKATA